ncbi:MAG: hypothetical protein J5925_03590 [Clostridia bacterium]|nr:hypothetical protein [Clostridia bacterium]
MKITKRLLNAAICVIIVFAAYGQTAIAHNASQQGIIAQSYMQVSFDCSSPYYTNVVGGEQVGWAVLESRHLNGATSSYAFASGVNNTYKQKFIDGALLWYGYASFNETNNNPVGTVTASSISGSTTIAALQNATVDSNGHYTTWEIWMNTAKNVTPTVTAHELGHLLGLNDLYTYGNIDKLMYYTNATTATGPTTYDIKGMQVITGSHTTHTWGYKYYTTNSLGQHVHAKYCTVCNGFHAASSSQPNVVDTGLCVYKNGICKICGNPENSTPW